MLASISFLLLTLSPSPLDMPRQPWDNFESNQDFNFYLGEFAENKRQEGSGFQQLVEQRLAESVFETNDADEFKSRLRMIRKAYDQYPDHLLRFDRLDTLLSEEFAKKMKRAKRIRTLSAVGGAAAGALVAIPIGKAVTGSLSAKTLLIAVPIGALAGAGAGFLLGDLIAMPDYSYEDLGIGDDLQSGLEEIDRVLGLNATEHSAVDK